MKSSVNGFDAASTIADRFGSTPAKHNILSAPAANGDGGVKKLLLHQMIRAKRAGTWFGLPKLQRSLYSLAMRLDVKLQSPELLRALVSVLKSLRQTCDRAGAALVRATRMAWALSEAAVGWGNSWAREWRNDGTYIRFLAISLEAT